MEQCIKIRFFNLNFRASNHNDTYRFGLDFLWLCGEYCDIFKVKLTHEIQSYNKIIWQKRGNYFMLHILQCITACTSNWTENEEYSYLIFLTKGTILTRTAEFCHRKLYFVTCSTFWADLKIKSKHWLLIMQNILGEAIYIYIMIFFPFWKNLTIAHP